MYGLSITKPDGSLWISPGFTPQCLINKGTIPATEKAFFKTSIPSGKSCFFFIRTEKKADVMYTHEQIDGYHALRLHQIVRGTNPGVTTVDPVNAKTGKIVLGAGCTTTQDGEWYVVSK